MFHKIVNFGRDLTPNYIMEIQPGRRLVIGLVALVYLIVLAPTIVTIPFVTNADFSALTNEQFVTAWLNSFKVAIPVAIASTVLCTIAARCYREVKYKNAYLVFMSLPILIPGNLHAMGSAIFGEQIGLSLGYGHIVMAHTFYTFPFGFFMVLAVMSGVPNGINDAALDLGATPVRAFFNIEVPLITDGIVSAFLISLLLSINESARSTLLGGRYQVISSLISSQYEAVGLTSEIYALNISIVGLAIILISIIVSLLILD
jgi:spermidine/putrescine transport system permease protein